MSYAEKIVKEIFKFYLPLNKVFYNYRPDWLKNSKTGNNLELDIYYPNLKLAIEYQGLHHKLKEQRKKDAIKQSVCEKKGIDLIFICAVFRIKRQIKRLYEKNPIKYKKFKKKLPKEFKKKINNYYIDYNSNFSKRYYMDFIHKLNMQRYPIWQRMETKINKRIKLAKLARGL